jgi:hypothetical protein
MPKPPISALAAPLPSARTPREPSSSSEGLLDALFARSGDLGKALSTDAAPEHSVAQMARRTPDGSLRFFGKLGANLPQAVLEALRQSREPMAYVFGLELEGTPVYVLLTADCPEAGAQLRSFVRIYASPQGTLLEAGELSRAKKAKPSPAPGTGGDRFDRHAKPASDVGPASSKRDEAAPSVADRLLGTLAGELRGVLKEKQEMGGSSWSTHYKPSRGYAPPKEAKEAFEVLRKVAPQSPDRDLMRLDHLELDGQRIYAVTRNLGGGEYRAQLFGPSGELVADGKLRVDEAKTAQRPKPPEKKALSPQARADLATVTQAIPEASKLLDELAELRPELFETVDPLTGQFFAAHLRLHAEEGYLGAGRVRAFLRLVERLVQHAKAGRYAQPPRPLAKHLLNRPGLLLAMIDADRAQRAAGEAKGRHEVSYAFGLS